eukprot:jgi/Bigna1/138000/aug1.42_g12708
MRDGACSPQRLRSVIASLIFIQTLFRLTLSPCNSEIKESQYPQKVSEADVIKLKPFIHTPDAVERYLEKKKRMLELSRPKPKPPPARHFTPQGAKWEPADEGLGGIHASDEDVDNIPSSGDANHPKSGHGVVNDEDAELRRQTLEKEKIRKRILNPDKDGEDVGVFLGIPFNMKNKNGTERIDYHLRKRFYEEGHVSSSEIEDDEKNNPAILDTADKAAMIQLANN